MRGPRKIFRVQHKNELALGDHEVIAWQHSLMLLLEAIPPPNQPKYIDGPLIDPTLPSLPDDHAALIAAYGSGEFAYSKPGCIPSCVIEVFNPRDPWHLHRLFREGHEILRDYRETEGDEYI